MSTSTETRIPTQTFLLPGQQFCIGMPWERADLPAAGVPALARDEAPVQPWLVKRSRR